MVDWSYISYLQITTRLEDKPMAKVGVGVRNKWVRRPSTGRCEMNHENGSFRDKSVIRIASTKYGSICDSV